MPLVSRLINHRKIHLQVSCIITALTERSRILNWQHWHRQTAELKPAEVKTKTDIGCCTADKRGKGHILPAFGRNNTETRKITPMMAHSWVWLRTHVQSCSLHTIPGMLGVPQLCTPNSNMCAHTPHIYTHTHTPLYCPSGFSNSFPDESSMEEGVSSLTLTECWEISTGPLPSWRFIFFWFNDPF